jgi:hypothetical protein
MNNFKIYQSKIRNIMIDKSNFIPHFPKKIPLGCKALGKNA